MRLPGLLVIGVALIAAACGGAEDGNVDVMERGTTPVTATPPAEERAVAADDADPAAPPGDGAANTRTDDRTDPVDRDDDASDGTDSDPADSATNDASGDPDVASIPARFHGEWNADLAACGTGSNPTRLRISADRIRFYESVGVVRDVDVESERVITVEAQYQGEGDTWSDERRLSLSPDGNSLTLSGGGDLVRYRCP